MQKINSGSCNCGAVRFHTHGRLRPIIYCHCTQCRKQTGHFYAATSVATDDLRIEGDEAVTWYAASPQALRGFCRTCGSTLFWKENDAANISIMAGAFDQPTGLVGGCHIYVADKGDYYEIADDLRQYPMRWQG